MSRPLRLILLGAIMLAAFALRVWGLQFGLPFAYARPDETEVAGPAVAYLSGNLRPPFFQWPSLFSYMVAATYALYGGLFGFLTGHASLSDFAASRFTTFAPFLLIPRTLSLAMGVATVGVVFVLARRVFDDVIGLVAAGFLAFAFLHVRDSHFAMTDVTMSCFVVAATLAAVHFAAGGGILRAALAGLLVGVAGSTKYNGLAAGAAFAAALVVRSVAARSIDRRPQQPVLSRAGGLIGPTLAFSLAAGVGFLGGSPYILRDWSRFVADVTAVHTTMGMGHGGLRVGRGWWHFGLVVLPSAVGWPIFLFGVGGVVGLSVWRWRQSAVLLAFPVVYFLYAGQSYSVFARYMVPVVPFLCVTAAWCLVTIVRRVAGPRSSARSGALALGVTAIAAVTPTAAASIQLDRLLATPDNRVVTARALADVLPAGDLIFQSGSSYGRVPLGLDGIGAELPEARWEAETGIFTPREPDWILVQRSPLVLYSRVPAALESILRKRFALVARFQTDSAPGTPRVYDQQDAFYLPLTGLAGLRRPGPSFELYRRR